MAFDVSNGSKCLYMLPYFRKLSVLAVVLILMTPVKAHSQMIIIDIIKAVAKKVIRAMDLQVQRMQNRTIDLQNIQKELENTLSKLKLDEIANWTDKQKQLYQEYYDELWKVKTILYYYQQFNEIVKKQKQLLNEYKVSCQLVGQDKNFSEEEIQYMYGVYAGILDASMNSVDDVLTIMKSFTVQMSDAERLEMIDKTVNDLDAHLTSLRQFNHRNQILSMQRAKSRSEIETVKKLYGLQ
jgi:hypothetical protein